MYIFSFPVLIAGLIWLVGDRRRAALQSLPRAESGLCTDGAMLLECWLIAMALCGLLTGSPNINRANGIYYALIIVCAYGLYQIMRRVRVLSLLVVFIYCAGFAGQCATYFSHDYVTYTAQCYRPGLYEAIDSIKTFPYEFDTIYLSVPGGDEETSDVYDLITAVALGLDRDQLSDEKELTDREGEPVGYYTDWFWHEDFAEFEPDPMGCAVYIVPQSEKALFSAEDYLLWDYEQFAVAYPRYWAED